MGELFVTLAILVYMLDNRDIGDEIARVWAGLLALLLLTFIGCRLWNWWVGMSNYKTFLGAVAGRPLVRGRFCWDYGLWELDPDGQLAGIAMIIVVLAAIGIMVFNRRLFYWVGGSVIAGGYLVNACLMIKLMAAY